MGVTLGIIRTHGACGKITCTYKTMEVTAVPGRDYGDRGGIIEFEENETNKTIEIPILKSRGTDFEIDERFKVILCDASPGVKFDNNTDGGEECDICTVVIVANKKPAWNVR